MIMNSTLKLVIYAVSAFLIFMLLTWILRLSAGKLPVENGFWGIYKDSDLLLGAAVAAIITLSHYQKRKIK